MASVDIMDLAQLARVYVQAERQGLPSAPLLRTRYDRLRAALHAEHVFGTDPTSAAHVMTPPGARGLHEPEGYMASEGLATLLRLPNTAELLGGSEYLGGWIKLLYGKYVHLLGFPERSEWLIEQAMRDCIAVLDPSLFVRAHGDMAAEEAPRGPPPLSSRSGSSTSTVSSTPSSPAST